MAVRRALVNRSGFNDALALPYTLRREVFVTSMDDVYLMMAATNEMLLGRGLQRLEDVLPNAMYSGMLSQLLVQAIGRHATGLTHNIYPGEHPPLIPVERNPHDSVEAAEGGVDVKVTNKAGSAVVMRSARPAWYCVFRYRIDRGTNPPQARAPTRFTDIWLARLTTDDFRRNPSRGARAGRTATAQREGVEKLRNGWLYRDPS